MAKKSIEFYKYILDYVSKTFSISLGEKFHLELRTMEEDKALGGNHYKNSGGYFDIETGNIIIFADAIKKIKDNPNTSYDNVLTYLLIAGCHEFEHQRQFDNVNKLSSIKEKNQPIKPIEKFMLSAEKLAILKLKKDYTYFYRKYHDNFLIEIDADAKAVRNAKMLANEITESNPNIVINNTFMDYYEKYCEYRFNVYDIPYFINRMNDVIKEYKLNRNEILKYFNDSIIVAFFNSDGTYKRVRDIMTYVNASNYDPLVVASLISSNHFLEQIPYLSNEEKFFVINNVIKMYNLNFEKQEYLKKHRQEISYCIRYLNDILSSDPPSYERMGRNTISFSNSDYYQSILNHYYDFVNNQKRGK